MSRRALTAETSAVRTGSYIAGRSRGGEDRKEDNVASPEVHRRGGDVNLFFYNFSNSDGDMT
jgi:hypothetical protein